MVPPRKNDHREEAWIRKRTRKEEKRLCRRSSSGRRRREKGRSNGSKRRRSKRSASRSGKKSGRNASGSVRKHGVSRRAPHEQEGPGVLAASALLLFASIHLSAWKTEPPSVRLQGTKNSRAAARG
jgi:hypothetical protein